MYFQNKDGCFEIMGLTIWIGAKWFILHDDRFKIQQFTGLKDKNNKEIYEGDIVSIDLPGTWKNQEVVFSKNCGAFIFVPQDGIDGDTAEEKDFILYQHQMKNTVIVGNVFENPEFLKN